MKQMEVRYQTANLNEVIRYFAKDFTGKPGEVVSLSESFVDPVKRTVVFKLMVELPDNT